MKKYLDTDDYIAQQAAPLPILLQALRSTLLQASPYISEKLAFNCPFYTYKGYLFCYLNVLAHHSVEWCFLNGTQLSNEHQLLQHRNRKMVAGVMLHNTDQLSEQHDALLHILHEAMLLHDYLHPNPKKHR